ncbi:hypothetical protein CCY99_00290 [Helicobacter sp. 16-1353]|uniref:hypothetical protein n=1 Tax=Helicobacter sp. 16-1353 TaxID=2004996 RepID=UPI000DCE39D2|nr:hypothetical protein [Helicobacter sp. 16-1353]RAX55171.1 hypothetical protein CCY99_00290 [Helicobacter sp. 16-1353]
MEDYLVTITNDLKDNNKKLQYENEALKQEILKLKEHIKVLENSDYINELESNVDSLKTMLKNERDSQKKLRDDVNMLSQRLDEFLALFSTYINDNEDNDIYDINDDKSLLFGINIDSGFIQNATIKSIKNYLSILKCNNIQTFTINDFSTNKKSDIILIGEVFADYIRLSNLANDINIYGLVEMSMPNIFEQNAISIKFYGNKNIEEDFIKFKKIYSRELNLKDSIL